MTNQDTTAPATGAIDRSTLIEAIDWLDRARHLVEAAHMASTAVAFVSHRDALQSVLDQVATILDIAVEQLDGAKEEAAELVGEGA